MLGLQTFSPCLLLLSVISLSSPLVSDCLGSDELGGGFDLSGAGLGEPSGGGPGGWKSRSLEGYPQYTYSIDASPGAYPCELPNVEPGPDNGTATAGDGQAIYSSTGNGVIASASGSINNNWTTGDQSFQMTTVATARNGKEWYWDGDEYAFKPVKFGGTASLNFELTCGGSVGNDSGWFADPATARASAGFNAVMNAGPPIGYHQSPSLTISGWADNTVEEGSDVDWVAGGGGTAAGVLKLLGGVVKFTQDPATIGDKLSFQQTAVASASETVGPAEVIEPAAISFSSSFTGVATVNLYTDGNTATANARAGGSSAISIGIVPDSQDRQDGLLLP